ncbi:MAG: PxKF domain-containing protein, partial [bacterium]|nr:PxKF domain-containing protein [bacterium]
KSDSTCVKVTSTPILQYKPETVLDGDGTVVVPSALWTPGTQKYWVDLLGYGNELGGGRINRKHADILEVPQLRTFIQDLITKGTTDTFPDHISATVPTTDSDETRLNFTLHSPLTLDLYDDFGNHTGFSTTTNSLEENIPGSTYLSFGEVQYVSVPSSAGVHLVMNGYEEGSFTLDIEETEGEGVVTGTTFSGVPSLANTKVTMDVPPDAGIAGASDLRIDTQGDGVTDIALTPEPGETVLFKLPLTVTAEDKTITLGEPLPPLTAVISNTFGDVVTDGYSGAPECSTTATVASSVGEYPITCTLGTLSSESYEFSTFVAGTLTIQYRWNGFLQPINDTAHQVGQSMSVFKGGSTIPVKFQLKDINGALVQSAVAPSWPEPQQGALMNASVDESVYSVSGTSGTVYKWDAVAQQYVYNWNTKGLATGRWYKISTQLDDGNIYSVTVGLK